MVRLVSELNWFRMGPSVGLVFAVSFVSSVLRVI